MDYDTWMRILGVGGAPGLATGGSIPGLIHTGGRPVPFDLGGNPSPAAGPSAFGTAPISGGIGTGQAPPTTGPGSPFSLATGIPTGVEGPGDPFWAVRGPVPVGPIQGTGTQYPSMPPRATWDMGLNTQPVPFGGNAVGQAPQQAPIGVHPLIAEALQNLMRGSSFASLLGRRPM